MSLEWKLIEKVRGTGVYGILTSLRQWRKPLREGCCYLAFGCGLF